MIFEQFARSRDFFYLAALFLGAGFGCILNRFRRETTARFRNLTVTIGLCFFSGTAGSLTAAIIFSNWMIFKETSLYLPMGILGVIIIMAFRFPRAVGFPIFIISGVIAVLIGFITLSFPAVENSGRIMVSKDRNNLYCIQRGIEEEEASFPEPESDFSVSFQTAGEDVVLEFRAQCSAFPGIFPLVGGINRGIIAEVLRDNELLYADSRSGWKVFSGSSSDSGIKEKILDMIKPFFDSWEIREKREVTELSPGTVLTVLFDGPSLAFR